MAAVQTIRGRLGNKSVAQYFKKSNKTNTIHVQRSEQGFYLTDRSVFIKTSTNTELEGYFPEDLEAAQFPSGRAVKQGHIAYEMGERVTGAPLPTKSIYEQMWTQFMHGFKDEVQVETLTPTRYLIQSGDTLWRRFDAPNDRHAWINREITDIFGKHPEDLEDFLWQQDKLGRVRVAHYTGSCAFVMPGTNVA